MGTIDKGDLGGRQQTVLEVLWKQGDACTTSQIVSEMEKAHGKKMTAQALNTVLIQLIDKGLVVREKVPGKVSVYKTLITQKEYQIREVKRMIKRTFSGSVTLLFATMADNGITPEEYEEIKELIEQQRKKESC